jgi:hypothetical protein
MKIRRISLIGIVVLFLLSNTLTYRYGKTVAIKECIEMIEDSAKYKTHMFLENGIQTFKFGSEINKRGKKAYYRILQASYAEGDRE